MINYTISDSDCYLKVFNSTDNITQDFKLSTTKMKYDSKTFEIFDGMSSITIAISNLANINSGAFATFDDLWTFINSKRSSCLASNNNLNGDVIGTYLANSIDKFKGISLLSGTPTDGQVYMYNAITNKFVLTSVYDNTWKVIFASVTDSTPVTGTTSETITRSISIPANTINIGDIIKITRYDRITGTAGTKINKIKINTDPSLDGPPTSTLLTTSLTAAASTRGIGTDFIMAIKSSSVTEMKSSASTSYSSSGGFTSATSQLNINWSVLQYILLTVTLSNSADSVVNSMVIVEKCRAVSGI